MLNAPLITAQPADQVATVGYQTAFTIEVSGDPPLIYKWQVLTNNAANWSDVTEATGATCTIPVVTAEMNGNQYRCIVTNTKGSVTSDAAMLTTQQPSITVKINDGKSILNANLESAISAAIAADDSISSIADIASIEITVGYVTSTDWNYIRDNRGNFKSFKTLKVADTVTAAADLPDSFLANSTIEEVYVDIVTRIGREAFYECSLLQNADFPKVTYIGENVFRRCSKLITAEFPVLEGISRTAFCDCSQLTTGYFPNATYIGQFAFSSDIGITVANFPKAVTIDQDAFYDARNLNTAIFPKVTNIVEDAFKQCYALSSLSLPANPPTVGSGAFSYCPPERYLTLVDEKDIPLAGADLNGAIVKYKADTSDGSGTDDYWYGWQLPLHQATFTAEPEDLTVVAGNEAAFTVAAMGNPPPTYQWQKDGVDIDGAIGESYTIVSAALTDAGSYACVATNPGGGVTSRSAVLTVIPPVASVTVGASGGGTVTSNYAEFYPAWVAADSAGTATVKLLANVSLSNLVSGSINVSGGDNITLDLNGMTIDCGNYNFVIESSASLTVKDGAAGGKVISNGSCAIDNNGTLNIEGKPGLTSGDQPNIILADGKTITITGTLTNTTPYTVQAASAVLDTVIATAETELNADETKFALTNLAEGTHLGVRAGSSGGWEVYVKADAYTVTLTGGDGYTLTEKEGSASPVGYGGSYSFTVTIDEAYSESIITVKANGDVLTADGDGVYTISNIQADQIVTVEGVTGNGYAVDFDENGADGGETMQRQSFIYGTPQKLTANAFTYTNHKFAGWAASADGSVEYGDMEEVNNLATSGTITLFAVWAMGDTYTVTFDKNADDATGDMTSQDFYRNVEQNLKANAFERLGYSFEGWAVSAAGAVLYADKANVTREITQDAWVTLYAQWTANTYTVTLDANGGTGGITSITAVYDAAMPAITGADELPTRTGYTFEGYFDAETAGTKYCNADGTSAATWDKTQDTTLCAKWTAHKYTVTFDKNADAATGSMADQLFTYDEAQKLTPNAFTRAGYTFAGWAASLDGAVMYTDGDSVSNLSATDGAIVSLYARWIVIHDPSTDPDPVAIIDENGESIPCKDLQEALDKVKPGQIIVVYEDQHADGELTIPTGVTLYIQSGTLTCGTLIITENATYIINEGELVEVSPAATKDDTKISRLEKLVVEGELVNKGSLTLINAQFEGGGTLDSQAGKLILKGKSKLGKVKLGKGVTITLDKSFKADGVTGTIYLPGECCEVGYKVVTFAGASNPANFKLGNAPDETWFIGSDGCLASAPTVPGDIIPEYLVVGKNTKTNLNFLLPWNYKGAVTWESADEKVLKVVKDGKKRLFKGVELGETTLTAAFADGKTQSVPVKVVPKKQAVSSVGGPSVIKLKRGAAKQLTPNVKPGAALDKTLFWHSSDEGVAMVKDGSITAVGTGTCRVVAVATSGKRNVTKVTVTKKAAIEDITLTPVEVTLKKGETVTLTATVAPDDSDQTLKWSSDKPKVASVKKGVVTAKKAGTATITCKFANGTKLTCTVTVGGNDGE